MSKVAISLALVCLVCSAQLSVNLKQQSVKGGADFVYTYLGDDNNIIFDTTATGDYSIVDGAGTPSAAGFTAFGQTWASTTTDNNKETTQIKLGDDESGPITFQKVTVE